MHALRRICYDKCNIAVTIHFKEVIPLLPLYGRMNLWYDEKGRKHAHLLGIADKIVLQIGADFSSD